MKNLLIVFLLMFSFSSFAFKLIPMNFSIEGGGKNNTALFTVQNDSDSSMAVQLEVRKRIMDIKGKETQPETEDFLIFPDQLILAPKKRRVVKVKWLKGEVKDIERSYRLIAEQLPINLKKKKKGNTDIKILLRYVAALYISPQEGKSKIIIEKQLASKKSHSIDFTVHNIGKVHEVLTKTKIFLSQEGKKIELKNLKSISGENILAGQKRLFNIKVPKIINLKKSFKLSLVNEK